MQFSRLRLFFQSALILLILIGGASCQLGVGEDGTAFSQFKPQFVEEREKRDQLKKEKEEQTRTQENSPDVSFVGENESESKKLVYKAPSAVTSKNTEKGQYLYHAVAACGSCHAMGGADELPAGGKPITINGVTVLAPNITSDAETGIGSLTHEEIGNAIRASRTKDGKRFTIAAHQGYRWLSNEDTAAIVDYVRTLPPVKKEIDRSGAGVISNVLQSAKSIIGPTGEVAGYVPSVREDLPRTRGRYLAYHAARCQLCHTGVDGSFGVGEDFSGNPSYDDPASEKKDIFPKPGPNIRGSAGLSKWSVEQIVQYLSSGKSASGKMRNGEHCPWPSFSQMSDKDKDLIARYLKSR